MAIYVHRNDQQLGPYTVAEVKSQLASGALSLTDPVWWKGEQGWVPLGQSAVLTPGFVDPVPEVRAIPVEPAGLSQFSVAALVAGVLFPFSFFTSVPAIIFGHFALAEFKEHPRRKGRGMALAGMGLGYFFTVVSVVAVGLWVYFHDEVEAMKTRDAEVHADVFVPPLPKAAPARATNLDQPAPPSGAAPVQSRPPAK